MAANVDSTPVLNRIYELLTSPAGSPPVYQHTEALPEPLPAVLYVLRPLFSPVREEWASRRDVTHNVQVTCCATEPYAARALAQRLNELLPPEEFRFGPVGPELDSGSHIELPVTVRKRT